LRSSVAALAIFAVLVAAPQPAQSAPDQNQFDRLLANRTAIEGYFTIHMGEDGSALLEIGRGQIGTPFLSMSSIARGTATGFFVNGMTAPTWLMELQERPGNRIAMVRKNTSFVPGDPSTPLGRATEKSFSDSPFVTVPVMATSNTGSRLVDLGALFLVDHLDFASSLGSLGGRYFFDRGASSWGPIKSFPNNTEIRANLVFRGGTSDWRSAVALADPRAVVLVAHYSLSPLPQSNYQPRFADDRIGYFQTVLYDFAEPARDGYLRYINRWNLQKADPSQKVSPAKKPVVFWMENTIPYEFRPYVREGIASWNRAFEAAGIKDAIEVRQQPDDADWDPEDSRYNTIRWTAAYRMGFAIGPSRVNPLTGEILDADILIDANFVRGFERAFRTRHTGLARTDGDELASLPKPGDQNIIPAELAAMPGFDRSRVCLCGHALADSMAVANAAFVLEPERMGVTVDGEGLPENYLRDAFVRLLAHEVGHTLGLRHNFRASTIHDLKDLKNRAFVDKNAFAGSVMDYFPVFVTADPKEQGYFAQPDIGPYDVWAIRYGYTPFGGNDAPGLAAIASESANPLHIFGTDDDAGGSFGVDPYCRRRDLGKEPLDYVRERYALVERLLRQDWSKVAKNDPDDRVASRSVFHSLLSEHATATFNALDFIGGVRHYRDHSTDPGAHDAVVPVTKAKQLEAPNLIVKESLAPGSLEIPSAVLRQLSPSRWSDWGGQGPPTLAYPIADVIRSERNGVLFSLHASALAQRIESIEVMDPNTLKVAEIYSAVTDAVWNGADGRSAIASLRQTLQSDHIAVLSALWIDQRGTVPTSSRSAARLMLERIDGTLSRPVTTNDVATQAHLKAMAADVKAALAVVKVK
jgi:hypothetical protein